MTTVYRVELWDDKEKVYNIAWVGTLQYAQTMMRKPYYRFHTRRLIKTVETVIDWQPSDFKKYKIKVKKN